MESENIFESIPKNLDQEVFELLVQSENVKIERIISKGHTSPETGWHDQEKNEWVIVLKGEAIISFEHGKEVNHQYSKSLAFEKAFRAVIRQRVSPGIDYFSLLRPFSECAITRLFSELTEFHAVFSSCNRNFHLDGSHIEGRWCQDCPKCRFTALALAPFMSPEKLLAIQGAELLDQEEQLLGFKELCGLGENKPFECVGSISESRAAMKLLASSPRWQDKQIVKALADYPEISNSGELVLEPDTEAEHCIPAAVMVRLNAF